MLAGGAPIEVVQKILGHSSPAVTRQGYPHTMKKATTGQVNAVTELPSATSMLQELRRLVGLPDRQLDVVLAARDRVHLPVPRFTVRGLGAPPLRLVRSPARTRRCADRDDERGAASSVLIH